MRTLIGVGVTALLLASCGGDPLQAELEAAKDALKKRVDGCTHYGGPMHDHPHPPPRDPSEGINLSGLMSPAEDLAFHREYGSRSEQRCTELAGDIDELLSTHAASLPEGSMLRMDLEGLRSEVDMCKASRCWPIDG